MRVPGRRMAYVAALAALALTTPSAQARAADVPALDFTSFATVNGGSVSFVLGWEFNVVTAFDVKSLGLFDYGGLSTGGNDVGIFDSGGNLLASTTVMPTDPQTGLFRFRALTTPVTLTPGNGYRIAAVTNGIFYTYDYGGPLTAWSVDPRLQFVGDRYVHGSALVFPTSEDPNMTYGWFGPNMLIDETSPDAVPEPALLQLPLLMGLGGLAYWKRRRSK